VTFVLLDKIVAGHKSHFQYWVQDKSKIINAGRCWEASSLPFALKPASRSSPQAYGSQGRRFCIIHCRNGGATDFITDVMEMAIRYPRSLACLLPLACEMARFRLRGKSRPEGNQFWHGRLTTRTGNAPSPPAPLSRLEAPLDAGFFLFGGLRSGAGRSAGARGQGRARHP
jgi:hypothetical protein